MRFLNMLVICTLVLAAAAVYKIKFDSTLQGARVGKLNNKLRGERDAIAVLRAEWAKLDTPARIQGLAGRHLALQPVKPAQFDGLNHLPLRSPIGPAGGDPIAALAAPAATGSVAAPAKR